MELFLDDEDSTTDLGRLKKQATKANLRIVGNCLMSNLSYVSAEGKRAEKDEPPSCRPLGSLGLIKKNRKNDRENVGCACRGQSHVGTEFSYL